MYSIYVLTKKSVSRVCDLASTFADHICDGQIVRKIRDIALMKGYIQGMRHEDVVIR